jgi:hypothetical protein
MRALVIIIADPNAYFLPSVVEAKEQGFVQELIAHASVEAFAEAVLHRLVRGDVMPRDLAFARPG